MRTLIIPDLHHHTERADHWLTTQDHDRVVFLGDYFDDFDDDVGDARRTAIWLRDRIEKTDYIFLLGNHDIAYMFAHAPNLWCPGFTAAKARGIAEILRPEHWQRLRLAHAEQGWLLSHAGFHPAWLKEPTVECIFQRCDEAMQQTKRGVFDPFPAPEGIGAARNTLAARSGWTGTASCPSPASTRSWDTRPAARCGRITRRRAGIIVSM
jgi:hypothetical protein